MIIHKKGKIWIPKDKKSRIYYVKIILSWLYIDLSEFKTAIEKQHAKDPIAETLQVLVNRFCKTIFYCADKYPIKSGKMLFDKAYSDFLHGDDVRKRLHEIICELNSSVLYFIKQHDMTIYSYKVHNPLSANPMPEELIDFLRKEKEALKGNLKFNKILPNRPKDWGIREIFKIRTEIYQRENGVTKFIPYKTFIKDINKNKNLETELYLKISAKSYYNLKQAWKNKSFDWFI